MVSRKGRDKGLGHWLLGQKKIPIADCGTVYQCSPNFLNMLFVLAFGSKASNEGKSEESFVTDRSNTGTKCYFFPSWNQFGSD